MNLKLILVIVLATMIGTSAWAQNDAYTQKVQEAEGQLMKGEYSNAAKTYTEAFAANGDKGYSNDRYNAACAWAVSHNPDSAFHHLFRIAEKAGYSNLLHMSIDPDLDSIHDDKRWAELCVIVKRNKDKAEEGLNTKLIAILDTIYIEDQKYRLAIDRTERQYGRDSKEMKALWGIMETKDRENLLRIEKILDAHGWLGADEIGQDGNTTLFLVIQHADYETQLKYLPMMREAVKQKKARGSALALLEDRVALRSGGKQIYGSQIAMFESGEHYVMPMTDPDNVDKRRADVGLAPLADYIKNWNIEWDVEAYKKQLPDIEAYEKGRRAKK